MLEVYVQPSLLFAVLAALAALVAVWFTRKALAVPIKSVGDPLNVDPQLMLGGWVFGALQAMHDASKLNLAAVAWTVTSVLLSAAASIASAFGA